MFPTVLVILKYVVRFLVDGAECDVNITDAGGWTPLHYACQWVLCMLGQSQRDGTFSCDDFCINHVHIYRYVHVITCLLPQLFAMVSFHKKFAPNEAIHTVRDALDIT